MSLKLKGEMILLPEVDSLLFVASPVVLNLNELNRKGTSGVHVFLIWAGRCCYRCLPLNSKK